MSNNAVTEMVRAAAKAAEAAQAAKVDLTEGKALMAVVERFLRDRGRLLYGGFALNALLPKSKQFYDIAKELPDYDFLTPDPLADAVELMHRFVREGYTEVEPAIGVHEGTYKVYVNFQAVADITRCDITLYERLFEESVRLEESGMRVCPANYLRMNMYLELSHPAGDVSRWEKVYKRLLLFNAAHPMRVPRCRDATATSVDLSDLEPGWRGRVLARIVAEKEVVLGVSEAWDVYTHPKRTAKTRRAILRMKEGPLLVLSTAAEASAKEVTAMVPGARSKKVLAVGEMVPEHVVVSYKSSPLVVFFHTDVCHAYVETAYPGGPLRIASMDTLVNFYIALYYAGLEYDTSVLCMAQRYVDWLAKIRRPGSATQHHWPFALFPPDCLGYQATLPELKRLQRKRSKEEKERLKEVQDLRKSIQATLSAVRSQTRRASKTASSRKTTRRQTKKAKSL